MTWINNKSNSNNNGVEKYSEAIFAWWCFWCMEWIFEAQYWVKEAVVWYAWWDEYTANYKDVTSGLTKHREAVKVIYDPEIISYETLVKLFWTQIDPTNPNWQFTDIWPQYETAIFYKNDLEKDIAQKSKKDLEDSNKFDKKIVTEILPYTTFFEAEDFHQNYYKKSAFLYNQYKKWSWREDFINQNWRIENLNYKIYDEKLAKSHDWRILLFFYSEWNAIYKSIDKQIKEVVLPDDLLVLKVNFDTQKDLVKKYDILTQSSFIQIDKDFNIYNRMIWIIDFNKVLERLYSNEDILKQKLTPLEYKVTRKWWTEPPFRNAYWDNYDEWIYVDLIDWTPLFSSTDKFESDTWWPSFSKPIDENMILEKDDNKLSIKRTEVVSVNSNSHLWHLFDDWPQERWWMRYCLNSAALKFIPKGDMKKMWYEKYLYLFEKNNKKQ